MKKLIFTLAVLIISILSIGCNTVTNDTITIKLVNTSTRSLVSDVNVTAKNVLYPVGDIKHLSSFNLEIPDCEIVNIVYTINSRVYELNCVMVSDGFEVDLDD